MKKVLLIPFLISTILISSNSIASANQNSTDIAYQIGEKYEVGETLNPQDQKIIKDLMANDNVYIKGEEPKIQLRKLVSGTKKI